MSQDYFDSYINRIGESAVIMDNSYYDHKDIQKSK